ncbi:hypothetical protein [Spirosoma fluminis]
METAESRPNDPAWIRPLNLPPLTPEEIEKNRAIYERLMDEVLGDEDTE